MSHWIATFLIATAQPGIGELQRIGADNIQECQNMIDSLSHGMNGRKILMGRCDELHPFMICSSPRPLDCVTKDVANGGEHSVIVRYHQLPKPLSDFSLDWVADSAKR